MLSATFRGTPPQMHHRGRSRHVSPVALARQASEERRRALIVPQSLEDQIQVAYALDDVRLVKRLLLKLKGIHVEDDSDPRIDQVRDEDFVICFAPFGPLTLDDADRHAIQENQRTQWWHESQRAQRLRACEKLWEDEKNRLHAEKQRVLQRREHDTDQDRAHKITQLRATRLLLPKPDQDIFQYAFMPPSKPNLPCRQPKTPKKTSARSPTRSVSFKEVINAMNGQLFPLDASERAEDARRVAGLPILTSPPQRRKASVRAELLDSLLRVVEHQEGERRTAKGKQVVREQRARKSPLRTPTMPSDPSLLLVTSVSSSTSTSRSSSWLSFGSWRSTATDITTPDSPASSPTSCHPCLPTLVEAERELYPRSTLVRISVEESPLCPPIITPLEVHDTSSSIPTEALSPGIIRGALVKRVTRSVATIVEAARGLQSAYITATMFNAGFPYHTVLPSQPHGPLRCQRQARREGYRALAKDVRKFTDIKTSINPSSEPVHFIPLVSQPSETPGPSMSCVSKNAVIFPSPLRPRTPPAALAYRMRPVANPAVLRLRALQNLMYARGKEWEGRAREGGLGCGKERMLGIAFEGRGRSGLGCEVRFVVV